MFAHNNVTYQIKIPIKFNLSKCVYSVYVIYVHNYNKKSLLIYKTIIPCKLIIKFTINPVIEIYIFNLRRIFETYRNGLVYKKNYFL